jgi:NAD(P)-dependent dehydrogenase (short-subunit alcohol dehydrogenase family)
VTVPDLMFVASRISTWQPVPFQNDHAFTMPKVWLITGSGNGLGRHITEAALASGDSVIAGARRTEELAPLEAQYGERVKPVTLEVRDEAAAKKAVQLAVDTFGRLDVLVKDLFRAARILDDPVRSLITRGGMRRGLVLHCRMDRSVLESPLRVYEATRWSLAVDATKLTAPILVVSGALDILTPPETGAALAALYTAPRTNLSQRTGTMCCWARGRDALQRT